MHRLPAMPVRGVHVEEGALIVFAFSRIFAASFPKILAMAQRKDTGGNTHILCRNIVTDIHRVP